MKRMVQLKEDWQVGGFAAEGFSPGQALEGAPAGGWMAAAMPADVHTLLMARGDIEDPAAGANDVASLWVERQVWVYRTRFFLDEPTARAPFLELLFQGLDTYADVYVNGALCAHFENMLVEHRLDIRARAQAGENRLAIIFWPFAQRSTQKRLPEGFWINYSTERAYARKAAYQVGWDWCPRVCTVGVWRPVYLCAGWGGVLDGLQMQTVRLEAGGARAQVRLCAQYRTAAPQPARVRFALLDADGAVCAGCEAGTGSAVLELDHPRLWWTHDQGEPYLYTLQAQLLDGGGHVLDTARRQVGVRTVRLERADPDTGAPRFLMVLNGRRIFARGANWVPASSRPASVTDEAYRALLGRARQAHMNTLCVWGGGIYEQEAFYDFCDREGILIWQYFMFACGEYPDFDPAFMENVRDEVFKAARRLTGHPSVELWIGNVESTMLCEKIGLERPMYGKALFEQALPRWLAEVDPDVEYLPSSPWGEGAANGMETGDRHNWDVWFKDVPYTDYCADSTLFASEFGVHGAPSMEVFRRATGLPAPRLEDFAVRYLNRDQSLDRMEYYLKAYTGVPGGLRAYIADTGLVQAMALACACGHYRHRFPQCGGALVWQLNDCCDAHSWSIVDSCNIPKAAWYFVRQAFRPVAVYLEERPDNETRVWVMNNGAAPVQTALELEVGDFLGERRWRETLPLRLAPGQSSCVRTVRAGGRYYPNVILTNRPRLYYLAATLADCPRPVVRYFERPKDLLLPPAGLRQEWRKDAVTVRADRFAQFVHLEGELEGFEIEDNYFDLLPGTQRTLRFCDSSGKGPQARGLRWTARNPKEASV